MPYQAAGLLPAFQTVLAAGFQGILDQGRLGAVDDQDQGLAEKGDLHLRGDLFQRQDALAPRLLGQLPAQGCDLVETKLVEGVSGQVVKV